MQSKRLEAALGGDLSKINALHLSRLEAHVTEAVVSGPAARRIQSRKREAMATPTLREVRIGTSAAHLAAAKWQHAATCLPETPSQRQLSEVMAVQIEAQAVIMDAEDLRAVLKSGAATSLADGRSDRTCFGSCPYPASSGRNRDVKDRIIGPFDTAAGSSGTGHSRRRCARTSSK